MDRLPTTIQTELRFTFYGWAYWQCLSFQRGSYSDGTLEELEWIEVDLGPFGISFQISRKGG
jgi:hypothetical protein